MKSSMSRSGMGALAVLAFAMGSMSGIPGMGAVNAPSNPMPAAQFTPDQPKKQRLRRTENHSKRHN